MWYRTVQVISYPINVVSSPHLCFWARACTQCTRLTEDGQLEETNTSTGTSHSHMPELCMSWMESLVCHIQDNCCRVDPGSFGFNKALLLRTSSFKMIRYLVRMPSSVPSRAIIAQHLPYTWQCNAILKLSLMILARARVRTPFRGATRMTWEY